MSRRKFIAASSAALAATAATNVSAKANSEMTMPIMHNVYFWLHNPASETDRDKLIEGLNTLRAIPTVKMLYIGLPANTEKRDVVDNSFQVSELMFFEDLAGQAEYQQHPIHQRFVENYSHLWKTVVVHDSVST